jgi:hemerythrin-like domain-containing protein
VDKSIIRILKAEHRQLLDLIRAIASKSNGSETNRIRNFAELAKILRRHSTAESRVLYPALRTVPDLKLIAAEASEQHLIIDTLLRELEASKKDTSEWMARFQVFRENVEHHIEKEEEEIFEVMGQYFLYDELDSMADRYNDELGKAALQETEEQSETGAQKSARKLHDVIDRISVMP